jgi:hypothetical protein
MQPQQWQLDYDEEEEAEEFRTCDVSSCRQVVWEVVELWPDGGYHHLQALSTLEGLRAKPDTSNDTSNTDCGVRSSDAERRSCEDREIDSKNTTNVSIQDCRDADQDMSDEHGEYGQTWIQPLRHGCRGDCSQVARLADLFQIAGLS